MSGKVETFDGWYALHDFRTFDWEKWACASEDHRLAALKELYDMIDGWQRTEDREEGSHAIYSILGQKADFLMMFLRPTMKELNQLETAWNKTALAHFTKPAYSYVSVIEKSTYTKLETNPYEDPVMRAKLYPEIPKEAHICFYPMRKQRGEVNNWYALSKAERGRIMYDHIDTVKPYSKDVKRIVTGSIGFDDYEWGVSLFCDDPMQFKKLLSDSRFDEVHAKYTDYGPFYVGHYLSKEALESFFENE